jgi:hypothetical protein
MVHLHEIREATLLCLFFSDICYCVFFLQSYFQGDDDGEEEMRVGLISLFHFRFSLSGWLAGWLAGCLIPCLFCQLVGVS